MAFVRAYWRKIGLIRLQPSITDRASGSSIAGFLGSAIALVAACALAACAADPPPEAVALPAPAVAVPAPQPQTDISSLLDSAPEPVVAGDPLKAALLRRFYARHGFEPVWTTHEAEATALVQAILRAGDQGLDPELFHARLLRDRSALPPLDREVLLSDAFLSYAQALAFGAVSVDRRRDDETLAPPPIDVAGVLDDAIGSPDPAAVIEALAPATPAYRALRQALRRYRAAGGAAATDRLRKIEVNLERQRWLPRPLPADRVWVDVAAERLVFYRADRPVFATRVVVGQDVPSNQSPEFGAVIDASLFNPPWVIPVDIVRNEILPKLKDDPDYLTRNKMVMLPGGEAEQLPGPEAGLGLIMFDMPNRFDVYLHDTPDREVFNLANRRISHGCIRIQHPRELAALLMQQPIDTINQGIARGIVTGSTTRNELPTPVPVFVVYQTVSVDADGRLQFHPDFYHRDAEIWQQLHQRPARRDQVAQADAAPRAQGLPGAGSAPAGD